MSDNAWVERILDELERLQTRNEDAKYEPVGLTALRLAMLSNASPADVIAWDSALQELVKRGLVQVHGRSLVELADQAWKARTGGVPGGEKDVPFLIGVLETSEDGKAETNNGFVSARAVYERLHWPFNIGEAHALADRLARQGLARSYLTNGGAVVHLKPEGLRAARQHKRSPQVLPPRSINGL